MGPGLIPLMESGLLSAQNGTMLFSSRAKQPLWPVAELNSTAATLQEITLWGFENNHVFKLPPSKSLEEESLHVSTRFN